MSDGGLPHFEVYRDSKGEWRWRFVASNGRVIADSAEGYKNKADCLHGIELIRTEAVQAPTVSIEANTEGTSWS